MKRSEINALLTQAKELLDAMRVALPPFAYWSPEDWRAKDSRYDEIREAMLGWDVTDYGKDSFQTLGLLLFTLRNGRMNAPASGKTYAEKLLIVREEQITPCHFHWSKMEDIINRGGGNLMIRLHESTPEEELSDQPVRVSMDGYNTMASAGAVLRLKPGQSITLYTGQYHSFWGEVGHGTVLVGEVSQVNDDKTDNRFYESMGRFPDIEEDEAPLHLLCQEYPPART